MFSFSIKIELVSKIDGLIEISVGEISFSVKKKTNSLIRSDRIK